MASDALGHLFDGMKFWVERPTESQSQSLIKDIQSHGGVAVGQPENASWGILYSRDPVQTYRLNAIGNLKIIEPAWIKQCLREGKKVSMDQFYSSSVISLGSNQSSPQRSQLPSPTLTSGNIVGLGDRPDEPQVAFLPEMSPSEDEVSHEIQDHRSPDPPSIKSAPNSGGAKKKPQRAPRVRYSMGEINSMRAHLAEQMVIAPKPSVHEVWAAYAEKHPGRSVSGLVQQYARRPELFETPGLGLPSDVQPRDVKPAISSPAPGPDANAAISPAGVIPISSLSSMPATTKPGTPAAVSLLEGPGGTKHSSVGDESMDYQEQSMEIAPGVGGAPSDSAISGSLQQWGLEDDAILVDLLRRTTSKPKKDDWASLALLTQRRPPHSYKIKYYKNRDVFDAAARKPVTTFPVLAPSTKQTPFVSLSDPSASTPLPALAKQGVSSKASTLASLSAVNSEFAASAAESNGLTIHLKRSRIGESADEEGEGEDEIYPEDYPSMEGIETSADLRITPTAVAAVKGRQTTSGPVKKRRRRKNRAGDGFSSPVRVRKSSAATKTEAVFHVPAPPAAFFSSSVASGAVVSSLVVPSAPIISLVNGSTTRIAKPKLKAASLPTPFTPYDSLSSNPLPTITTPFTTTSPSTTPENIHANSTGTTTTSRPTALSVRTPLDMRNHDALSLSTSPAPHPGLIPTPGWMSDFTLQDKSAALTFVMTRNLTPEMDLLGNLESWIEFADSHPQHSAEEWLCYYFMYLPVFESVESNLGAMRVII